MHIEKIESLQSLDRFKRLYLTETTAPLDGMWLNGFVPAATHFGWRCDRALGGYFCVNDDGYLLQFYVAPRYRTEEVALFQHVVVRGESAAGAIQGVFVSTAEPHVLSLCLDHFGTFEVNTLMYSLDDLGTAARVVTRGPLALAPVTQTQLPRAVAFAVTEIDAPEQWVAGYYANLIERGELYGLWRDEELLATGESRRRDEPERPSADLGVIVARALRGQGLATKILATLAVMNDRVGVQSICSTERDNHAARKAIARAGFVAHNRIVRFDVRR